MSILTELLGSMWVVIIFSVYFYRFMILPNIKNKENWYLKEALVTMIMYKQVNFEQQYKWDCSNLLHKLEYGKPLPKTEVD